jgi:hypothetical protein
MPAEKSGTANFETFRHRKHRNPSRAKQWVGRALYVLLARSRFDSNRAAAVGRQDG